MSEIRTVFKKVDYDLSGLLHYVEIGDIGLPDIQRPFVWTSSKVRDLFDSMYRGFPIGYLLFWSNAQIEGTKSIGIDDKQHPVPKLLIVDGQQRLTSLYAVFRGRLVLDENYREKRIEIAFRPRDGRFEVTDAAIRKDPEFIPNISELWASDKSSYSLVKQFLDSLRNKRQLDERDEETISHSLDRLFDLQKFPFTALEIASSVDEEHVADIFVRINSEGVKLNQADFILTLLSVFWDKGRRELEEFSRASRTPPPIKGSPSPFNHFIEPAPDQLLRVSLATGFHRARLKAAYQVLRGKDVETDSYSADKREEQFEILRQAQEQVLDLTHWHQFLSALVGAGFRSGAVVSSKIALLYSYALYLIGKTQHHLPEHELQRLMGRWFFMVTLSRRYSASSETVMDQDLNRIRSPEDGQSFGTVLARIISDTLTNDFWTITVPNELETSSVRSPTLSAYYAAQVRLGAPVLFSHKSVESLLDPTIKLKKQALDRHHLFPRAWLKSQGIQDVKAINQIANFALLEWPNNIEISAKDPRDYVPVMKTRFNAEDWGKMCDLHALPDGWERMRYEDFLDRRRELMANVIRRGFESLSSGTFKPIEVAYNPSDLSQSSEALRLTQPPTPKVASSGLWSVLPEDDDHQSLSGRDFYVSFGDGPEYGSRRLWEDAVQFGFVSAGGGRWYSKSLHALSPGDRVFVLIPQKGYVGVGIVEQPAVSVDDFLVDFNGETKTVLSAGVRAKRMGAGVDDPDLREYLVRVRWLRTLPREEAIWEKGMYANQNSATKFNDKKTLKKLIDHFGLA